MVAGTREFFLRHLFVTIVYDIFEHFDYIRHGSLEYIL